MTAPRGNELTFFGKSNRARSASAAAVGGGRGRGKLNGKKG